MLFRFDFSALEEADDGDTTHYGGVVKVNEAEVQARGTDRDWILVHALMREVERQLGSRLTDEQTDALDEAICDVYYSGTFEVDISDAGVVVQPKAPEPEGAGEYLVAFDNGEGDLLMRLVRMSREQAQELRGRYYVYKVIRLPLEGALDEVSHEDILKLTEGED